MFDGVCDETKKIQTLYASFASYAPLILANLKWIRSSSGNHMFVRFDTGYLMAGTGFSANIHYGKKIVNQNFEPILPTTNRADHTCISYFEIGNYLVTLSLLFQNQ